MKAWVDGNVMRMLWLYMTTPRIPTSEVSTLLRNLNVELGGMCVVLTNGLSIRRYGGMGTWVPLSRDGEDACSYLAPIKMAVRSISPLEAMGNVNQALRRKHRRACRAAATDLLMTGIIRAVQESKRHYHHC